jgi:prepilin-type N-terminal cleavage/methylation domain-containing protein
MTRPPEPRPDLQAQNGFTLVELTVALTILVTGILGLVAGFDSSRKLSLISERHATMSHVAEQEIERLEGMSYSQIAVTTSPTHATDPKNPDYYVTNGSAPVLQYDRTGSSTEPVIVDATGAVQHLHSQQQGTTSYNVYDYVTWAQDPKCSPGCLSNAPSYKRITVAVTISSGVEPAPVWSSSTIADPAAKPQQGIQNGNGGNPIQSPSTYCLNSSGQQVECIQGGVGHQIPLFPHDCPVTSSSCSPPSGPHATPCTVGACSVLCPLVLGLGGLLGDTSGCPVPDTMDPNPPPPGSGGTIPPCYQYSTDVATTGYPCGTLIDTTGGTRPGPPSASDCSDWNWSNGFINRQRHMWVASPVTADTTLTGDGALTMFSQMANGAANASAVVTFCIELYDIPPTNGVAGSLADILLTGSQPKPIGVSAAYIPPSDPSTGGNWPTGPTQTSFEFRVLTSPTAVYVLPAGHRLGIAVWVKVNVNAAVDLIYDNPNFPAELLVNAQ